MTKSDCGPATLRNGCAAGFGGLDLPAPQPRRYGWFSGSGWFVLGIVALVISGGLVAAMMVPSSQIAQYPDAVETIEIAPAAGPNPAANAKDDGKSDNLPLLPAPKSLEPLNQ